MMKISTMAKLGATVVGPQGNTPIADSILAQWDHDEGSSRWFRASANFVFRFTQDGELRFLRFVHSSERDRLQIEEETHLLMWLAQQGFHVAEPILSRQDNLVETVDTAMGAFHAVVFTALEGQQFDSAELSASQFHTWGATLGTLHSAMRRYKPTATERRSWKEHIDFVDRCVPHTDSVVRSEFGKVQSWLEKLPVMEETFGLIHFDFELDNAYWNGTEQLGMLDFDDCAYYWYAADIAFALRDLLHDGVDDEDPFFKAFLEGYTARTTVDQELLSQLPMFLRLHNLLLYTKLVNALDLPSDQVPEWLRSLHQKLVQRVQLYRRSLENPENIRVE